MLEELIVSVFVWCMGVQQSTVLLGQAITDVLLAVEEERLLRTFDNPFLLLGKIVSGNMNNTAA